MQDEHSLATSTDHEFRWRLLAALHRGGARLAESEEHLARAEAGLERVDAVIAGVRAILDDLGITVSPPTQSFDSPPNLTAQEFARRVKMSAREVRRILILEGAEGVHYYMVGRRYRVRTVEAERLFTQRRTTAREPEDPCLPETPPTEISDAAIATFRQKARRKEPRR